MSYMKVKIETAEVLKDDGEWCLGTQLKTNLQICYLQKQIDNMNNNYTFLQ